MSHDDFDLESVASYLHISPTQAKKMAERGTLPGRRVAGAWRFPPSEIHHWLEDRIGVADDEDLDHVEGVLRQSPQFDPATSLQLSDLVPTGGIAIPLRAKTQSAVITAMVGLAEQSGRLWNSDQMIEAVKAREKLHPTALENGAALLHPRRPLSSCLSEPIVTIGITTAGIPFGASHGKLTDVFFLLCSTSDSEHLRVLARVSRLIAKDGFLAAIRNASAEGEAREWIEQLESTLVT